MLERLKHTAKHSLIYGFGNLSTKLIGLILLPLYTSRLSTAEYGILAYLDATNLFLVAALSFSFPTAILRFCASAEPRQQKQILFTIFSTLFFSSVVLLIPLFFIKKELASSLLEHSSDTYLITLMLCIVPFEIFNQLLLSVIRLKEKSSFYVILTVLKLAISLILNVYFIVYRHLSIDGILLSQLWADIVLLVISFPFLLRNVEFKYQFSLLKEMLKYSLPLVFSSLSTMILTLSDRYVIEYLADFSELGVYSLGTRFSGLINVFILQSFQLGFLPIAFKVFDKPNAKEFFAKVLTYLTLALMISALGLSLFSQEVIYVFANKNKDFWRAYGVIPLLSLGFVFKGIQYILLLGLHFVKKTQINAVIVILASALNIGLNFLFIPHIGIYGSALATMISYIVMCAAYYYYSQKYYPINFEFNRLTLILVSGIACFLLSYFLLPKINLVNFAIRVLIFCTYPVILYFLGFYHKVELEKIAQFWNKWNKFSSIKENLLSLKGMNQLE